MPNRVLKESICYSSDIDMLTPFEETVFYRLMVNVDDYGRIDGRVNFLKSKLFVTKKGVTEKNVEDAILKLASIGLVQLYEVDEKPFLSFPKWEFHQTIRNKKSRYPEPSNSNLKSIASNCNQLQANVPVIQSNPIQSESNPNTNPKRLESHTPFGDDKPKNKKFKKPTMEEIAEYCKERRNSVKADRFFDYYESKGWLIGKAPMKDWKATVRNWERNHNDSLSNGNVVANTSYDVDELEQYDMMHTPTID